MTISINFSSNGACKFVQYLTAKNKKHFFFHLPLFAPFHQSLNLAISEIHIITNRRQQSFICAFFFFLRVSQVTARKIVYVLCVSSLGFQQIEVASREKKKKKMSDHDSHNNAARHPAKDVKLQKWGGDVRREVEEKKKKKKKGAGRKMCTKKKKKKKGNTHTHIKDTQQTKTKKKKKNEIKQKKNSQSERKRKQ
ncbi:hypothetical protein RFI_32202 [Reticulomyxa filosa]|uniref:Uncharacterized protein n=1 Tax=Reticulomyxa filosa TaxID=46433 RepID=X6LVK8_RETFI|nr:hypothetical protein RFI_32202 [Reticulomyxa filosa]|eukprot:ETO05192.1 hypothetical protein RFI_32202 [Reticulomyxa filosa]